MLIKFLIAVLLLVSSVCYARDRIISYTDKNGNTVYTMESAPSNREDTSSKGDLIHAKDNGEVNKRSGNVLLDNNANKANSINQPGAMFTPIIKKAFDVIIPALIALGITEILFILAARYIAKRKGWPKSRAILIAELLWLPVAFLIAMNCIQQLGSIGKM
jgi:hypothetical protein